MYNKIYECRLCKKIILEEIQGENECSINIKPELFTAVP